MSGPSLSQQASDHRHHNNLGSVSQHCPPTTSGIIVTQGGKYIHPSQHTGYILHQTILRCYRFYWYVSSYHRLAIKALFKICIKSYFASHTWLSHSPCTLQVSTMQTCIHNNIKSIVGPYYQHYFLSSHKIIKLIASWMGAHVPHHTYHIISRFTINYMFLL